MNMTHVSSLHMRYRGHDSVCFGINSVSIIALFKSHEHGHIRLGYIGDIEDVSIIYRKLKSRMK